MPPGQGTHGFHYDSGSLVLDFINTFDRSLRTSPHLLQWWLVEADLAPFPGPGISTEDLKAISAFADALANLAMASASHMPFNQADLDCLNAWANECPIAPLLALNGFDWEPATFHASLAVVAIEGVELFGRSTRNQIRKCSNENCSSLFLDRSKTGRRRWCSMAGCGNYAKVAAFNKRKKAIG